MARQSNLAKPMVAPSCARLGAAVFALLLASGLSLPAQAQDYQLSGGAFTTEQAERGETAYIANCAGCHGDDLRSIDSNAPDLRGPTFQHGWTGSPLAEKYQKIIATMPPGMGGSLSDETYADIVAFILATNGAASGNEELPGDADALQAIEITQP